MTARLRRWFTVYLVAWTAGALGATFSHLLLNEEEATNSRWEHSAGWQREIGLFNLAIAFILVQVIRRGDDESRRIMGRTAVVLALALGTNHVVALAGATTGGSRIHWTALALNAASLSVSSTLLVIDHLQRRRSPDAVAAHL